MALSTSKMPYSSKYRNNFDDVFKSDYSYTIEDIEKSKNNEIRQLTKLYSENQIKLRDVRNKKLAELLNLQKTLVIKKEKNSKSKLYKKFSELYFDIIDNGL